MKFFPIPDGLLSEEQIIPCNIYVRVSTRAVKIYKKNTKLCEDDIQRINNYPSQTVLFDNEGYEIFLQEKAKTVFQDDGKINEKSATTLVAGVFNPDKSEQPDEQFDRIITNSSTMVQGILTHNDSIESGKLLKLIKSLENEDNVLLGHANKVCLIGMTIALLQKEVALEFLNDIGIAAMLHGAALFMLAYPNDSSIFDKYLDKKSVKISRKTDAKTIHNVIYLHTNGHLEMTSTDEIIFLQHFNIIESGMNDNHYKTSPLVKKIMSDFRYLNITSEEKEERNPHVASKILLIADRIVCLLGHDELKYDIKMIVQKLHQESKTPKGKLIFSPQILDRLDQLIV